jgi:hypothetical protein
LFPYASAGGAAGVSANGLAVVIGEAEATALADPTLPPPVAIKLSIS